MKSIRVLLLLALMMSATLLHADNIWDLQAVNADGTGSHPKVGAALTPENKVTIEGIALNSPAEILNTDQMWQVYVQAESPDQGGIAAWAGIFYDNVSWPRYPVDIASGDRIRIEGWIDNVRGKVNITERHTPGVTFTVTKLQTGAGMPTPVVISDLGECNDFDQTRSGGGERYQSQWVRLDDVEILSGTWGAGNSLILRDDDGDTITMLLAGPGDFDSHLQPAGRLSVLGIFDQEDLALPYHGDYRIWVKKFDNITEYAGLPDWDTYHFQRD
ncbi:MAG TPA: hypothetical protein PLB62_15065 [Candidatus Sumerlaeota bacterium]|nr:hypothetical protein [Candidatus Sumerlaeota bacterium]